MTETASAHREETIFKTLFESAPGLYLVLLPDLTIYAVNDAYADATMTRRENIVGKYLFAVFPDNPDDSAADGVSNLRASLNLVLQNKIAHAMAVQKYDIRRPDGTFEERYWSPFNKPVLDSNNEVMFIIHRVEDVTNFVLLQKENSEKEKMTDDLRNRAFEMEVEIVKRSQEIQKLNEQLELKVAERNTELETVQKVILDYKFALDSSCIVAVTDQKGIIQHVNDNFCKISKYNRQELVGQDHRIINSGFHDKEFIRKLWVTIANGKIWRGELRNKAKDGSYYWVDTTIVPFLNEQGRPYQYIAIRADITARKEAEEYLERTLKEVSDYKYAIDESSIVAITDQKGAIKHANNNFCKISKYGREELIGRDHRIINSGFHSKEFIRKLWLTIAKGKIWRGELKNRAKDGSYYWVDTTIVPFLDGRGKPYQYIAIRADITGRKLVEDENIRLNHDLELRVKQRTEELEAFSYSISHDLRAPLRAVNGYARMLEEDYAHSFDAEGKRLLHVVQENANKMDTLINNMLAFSRIGKKDINRSIIDMKALAEDVWGELSKDNHCKAKIQIGELESVLADRVLMNQVWVNLLSNAIKYSSNEKEPVVKVSSEKKKDMIVYSVTDNGAGFDMQYAHKLFGVFQRLHSAEDFEGTGVGLAIVHRVITKHGGTVWAKGEIGKGAIFCFSLPAKKI